MPAPLSCPAYVPHLIKEDVCWPRLQKLQDQINESDEKGIPDNLFCAWILRGEICVFWLSFDIGFPRCLEDLYCILNADGSGPRRFVSCLIGQKQVEEEAGYVCRI